MQVKVGQLALPMYNRAKVIALNESINELDRDFTWMKHNCHAQRPASLKFREGLAKEHRRLV